MVLPRICSELFCIFTTGIMCDLLWSDPQPQNGRSVSKRGVGTQFGPDVTRQFLLKNKLDYVIRSHEVKQEGYEEAHDGKCITVFSAPNYWYVNFSSLHSTLLSRTKIMFMFIVCCQYLQSRVQWRKSQETSINFVHTKEIFITFDLLIDALIIIIMFILFTKKLMNDFQLFNDYVSK